MRHQDLKTRLSLHLFNRMGGLLPHGHTHASNPRFWIIWIFHGEAAAPDSGLFGLFKVSRARGSELSSQRKGTDTIEAAAADPIMAFSPVLCSGPAMEDDIGSAMFPYIVNTSDYIVSWPDGGGVCALLFLLQVGCSSSNISWCWCSFFFAASD